MWSHPVQVLRIGYLIKASISDCRLLHKGCKDAPAVLRRRLLDLAPLNSEKATKLSDALRLEMPMLKYATLSHSWGPNNLTGLLFLVFRKRGDLESFACVMQPS
jgi:hypothetical protein